MFEYTASGGMIFGGTASVTFSLPYTASGKAVFGGSIHFYEYVAQPPQSTTRFRFLRPGASPSVKVYYGGYAPVYGSKKELNASAASAFAFVKFDYMSSGGFRFSGESASAQFTLLAAGTGNAIIQPSNSHMFNQWGYFPSGCISTGGGAVQHRTYEAGGKVSFGNGITDIFSSAWAYSASGGMRIFTQSYDVVVAQQAPEGYWKLNETSGSVAADSSGNGLNAAYTGGVVLGQTSLIESEANEKSVRFGSVAGGASRVLVPDGEINGTLAARTVSFVMNTRDTSFRHVVYDEGDTTNGLSIYWLNDVLYAYTWQINTGVAPLDLNNSFSMTVISTTMTEDTSYHVAFAVDYANEIARLYVNGALVGSSALVPGGVPVGDLNLQDHGVISIGAKNDGTRYHDTSSSGTGSPYRGNLQSVAVWDRVLTPQEVGSQFDASQDRYFMTTAIAALGIVMSFGSGSAQTLTLPYLATIPRLPLGDSAGVSLTFHGASSGGARIHGGTSPVEYIAIPGSQPRFGGGITDIVSSSWTYVASGVVSTGGSGTLMMTYVLEPSGNVIFGESAPAASSNWAYEGGGLVMIVPITDLNPFISRTGSGLAVLGGGASVENIMTPETGGLMSLGGSATYHAEFITSKTMTWNISRGILRWFRVEGSGKPFSCPPVSGPANICKPTDCVKFVMNVQAASLGEVCEKLKAKNFTAPIKRIQLFSVPVNKSDAAPGQDLTCNSLTELDPNVPECLDLLVDENIIIPAVMTATVYIMEDFVASGVGGRVSFGGSAEVTSNAWAYVGSGLIDTDGTAAANSPESPIYVGEGGASFGGSATYQSSDGGTFVIGILGSTSIVGESIIFGFQNAQTISTVVDTVETECCGDLPTVLYLNHDFTRFTKLDRFLFVNSMSMDSSLRLVYSRKRGTWYNNLHYKGTSATDEVESWDIVTEFGCLDVIGGLEIGGNIWGFMMSIRNRNLTKGSDYSTKVLVVFDPVQVCSLDGTATLDFSFDLNVRNRTTIPSSVQTVVLYDELHLMKGAEFNRNPILSFSLTSVASPLPISVIDNSDAVEALLS